MLYVKRVNRHFLCTDVGVFSVGAALGPLLAGLISPTGWNNVFYMLITADVLACLVRNTTLYIHRHHFLISYSTTQQGFFFLLLIPAMIWIIELS